MNERKAKDLRDFIRAGGIPYGVPEKKVRRALHVMGEVTAGEDVLRSCVYAANATAKMKRNRENTAYSLALTQLRGRANVPRGLWRQDAMGEWVTGRERLKEIVKEAIGEQLGGI